MNKLNIEQLKKLVIATLLIILGIFFCCSLSMGINGLSILLGIVLLLIGIFVLINAMFVNKQLLSTTSIIGISIVSLGIMFIAHKLAGIIFIFIPWFLIILGLIIIVDSFLGKFSRKESNSDFIIKLALGFISLILGLCLLLIKGFAEYSALILGLFIIVYALYLIFVTFIKSSN